MAKNNWKQILKALLIALSSTIGALAVAMSFIYGTLDLALGADIYIKHRVVTIFVLGVGLFALGYGVVYRELSADGRKAFVVLRLIWVLMFLGIFLIGRFGLVLLNRVPPVKIAPWSIEIVMAIFGVVSLTLMVILSRSSLMRKSLFKQKRQNE